MAQEFTAKFKVDISDLKKNISEANKEIKLANATFKAETAGMENWSKNADGLGKKLDQLKSVLSSQKTILASYQDQLKRQEAAYNENGQRAEQLKAKLQQLSSQGVAKTDEEYKKYENSLKSVLKEQENNGKACDDLKLAVLNQQAAVNKTEADIKKYGDSLKQLETEQSQAADAANKQKSAYDSLESTINKQQNDLNSLKKEYAEVVLEQGKNSDAAKKLAGQISDLSSDLRNNKDAMDYADKAADDLDKSLDEVGDSAEKAGGKFDGLGAKIASGLKTGLVAVGTAAASAVAGLAGATVSAASYADEIKTMSAVTGMSAESLQAYNYAAGLVDVSIETLTGSMKKNITSMQSASKGTGAAADAYKKLGVDVVDSNGKLRDGETVYWEAIDALGKMEEGTERDALAMSIFGKSAQELNPLIETGSDGIKDLTEEAEAMGAVMSGDAIDALGNFDDSLERLKGGAGAAKNALGTVLLPQLQTLADEGTLLLSEFTNGINDANGDWSKISEVIGNVVGDAANVIISELPKLMQVGTQIVTALVQAITQNLPMIAQVFTQVVTTIGEALPEIGNQLVAALPAVTDALLSAIPTLISVGADLIAGLAEGAGEAIPEIINQVIEITPQIVDALLKAMPVLLNGAVQFFMAIIEALPQIVELLSAEIPRIVKMICDFLVNNLPILLKAAIQLFMALVEAIPQVVSSLLSALPQILDALKTGLLEPAKEKFSELWSSIKDVFANVKDWFGEKFGEAWEAIKAKFQGWADFWGGLWDRIKEKFSALGTQISDAISGAVKTGINGVISLIENTINGAIRIINGAIALINKIPGVSVNNVNPVSLPRLARGGVLKKGQVGLLEGSGAEAVVPLDQNKKWVNAVANTMLRELQGGGGSIANNSLSNNKVANFTQNIYAPRQPSRIELYRQTRNLLAFANVAGGV